MTVLLTNIKELLQVRETNVSKVSGKEMKHLPIINDAYLLIEDDLIIDYGEMKNATEIVADRVIDAS